MRLTLRPPDSAQCACVIPRKMQHACFSSTAEACGANAVCLLDAPSSREQQWMCIPQNTGLFCAVFCICYLRVMQSTNLFSCEWQVSFDDALHLLLDGFQVLFSDRLWHIKVIVEASLYGRPYGDLRPRKHLLDGHSHDVRALQQSKIAQEQH